MRREEKEQGGRRTAQRCTRTCLPLRRTSVAHHSKAAVWLDARGPAAHPLAGNNAANSARSRSPTRDVAQSR